jgi:hypothetical protein
MKQPKFGRIVKAVDKPKRVRNAVPRTAKAMGPMWEEMWAVMRDNRIGYKETYLLIVPEEVLEEYGIKSIRAAARPIKKKVKRMYGKKYFVEAVNITEGPCIEITHV